MKIEPHKEYSIEIEGCRLIYSPSAGTYEFVEGATRIDLTASYADQEPLLRAFAEAFSELADQAAATCKLEGS